MVSMMRWRGVKRLIVISAILACPSPGSPRARNACWCQTHPAAGSYERSRGVCRSAKTGNECG